MISNESSLLQIINLTVLCVQQLLRKISFYRRPDFYFIFSKHIILRQTILKLQFHLVVIDFFTELNAEKYISHCLRNQ